jgi:hypothetical protein
MGENYMENYNYTSGMYANYNGCYHNPMYLGQVQAPTMFYMNEYTPKGVCPYMTRSVPNNITPNMWSSCPYMNNGTVGIPYQNRGGYVYDSWNNPVGCGCLATGGNAPVQMRAVSLDDIVE